MKKDIILAGVGGQGILSIAAIIGFAGLKEGLHIKQAEVHGMSQRGGAVQSHFRVSSKPIFSDLIHKGKADLIISVEPMESLRYTHMLKKDGWIITNTSPFVNIPDYPEMDEILDEIQKIPNHVALDADKIAKDLKAPRSVNIVVLGASAPHLDIEIKKLEAAIFKVFGRKGEDIVNQNLEAFRAGLAEAEAYVS
jgi:indolepyruvate ferredoxin oxidoreductase beta subunit